ncbi:Metalloenzyme, LuxS/M16 peptidase-like protein [Tuber brumale]|nr:Metalloenzyme, LuxS/M16 peptidase-like protein [Tuber brumale]
MIRSTLLKKLSPPLSILKPRCPFQNTRRAFASSILNIPTKDPVELDNITALPNGVRVATEALPGHFSGLGVYIDAGSRYENSRIRGVSHLIDRLAFKSTSSRSSDKMLETLESFGGNVQCASSRESLMYQAAVFNKDVPSMMGILAETIRDPLITEEEVVQQLDTAAYEIQEIWAKPELILPELLHMTAYRDNTLGNPLLCPEDRLDEIKRETILEYRNIFYRPERIVIAFAGVDHSTAVKLAERYFGDMKSAELSPSSLHVGASPLSSSSYPSTLSSGVLSKIPLAKNLSTSASRSADVHSSYPGINLPIPSHYTGGTTTLPPSDLPSHLPTFTQLQIAFEGLPISDPDIYALAALQTLLGGGGSFSAGGPGKGMYSRLFINALNQHGWIESCVAFNHSYTDSGLFGIAASCHPGAGPHLVDVILKEFTATFTKSVYSGLKSEEVDRAKKQLQSSLLMNLESRMVELEDLGRQVQVHGKKLSPLEMCHEIEKLGVKDVRRVAERVLLGQVENAGKGRGGATVVVQGGEEEVAAMGDLLEVVGRYGLGRK